MGRLWNKIKRTADLSYQLAKMNFRLKNEGTWLGILWYLLVPIITFLLMRAIFEDRLGTSIPDYPLYLLLGIIIFDYFQKTTNESTAIIRGERRLIKSINFPIESLIGSVVIKNLFSHVFEIIILIGFLIFYGLSIKTMIFYPVVLVFLSIFVFGSSLILASVGAHFFDLDNMWGFLSKLIWFATPIFYAIEGQTRLGILNLFNPMYYFITISRDLIIYTKMPDLWMILIMLEYCAIFLIAGLLLFSKLKPRFAEII